MVTHVTTELSDIQQKGTVVMGGTFDPIHHGHLRSAVDILDYFQFRNLRLIPCYQPVHKDQPSVSAEQRLEMVRLGIQADERLSVDEREIVREGRSYSIDTLTQLRHELGADEPLIMVVGMDSFLSLPTWSRWQELLSVAHILVISRPGWSLTLFPVLSLFMKSIEPRAQLSYNARPLERYGWRVLHLLQFHQAKYETFVAKKRL